jgi:peptidoglycan/LPS O-acetylase OafA/YrhL
MSGAVATEPRTDTGRLHLGYIDGLRAIAALVVFFNHAYAQSLDPLTRRHPDGVFSVFELGMVTGHLSVTAFIVISGFCLGLPVVRADGELRGGVLEFLRRRARRILPPYYGALALCLALIYTVIGDKTGTLWDVPVGVLDPPNTRTAIVSHLLLLQDLVATSKINYVFWSIAVEWQLYFAFPLIARLYRLAPRLTLAGALALGYALRIGLADTRVWRACPHFLGMFTLGLFAAHVAFGRSHLYERLRQAPWAAIAGGAAAALAVILAVKGVAWSADNFALLDLPAGLLAAAVLTHASTRRHGRMARALGWAPLSAIGAFSYSLYLVHAPLLQLWWQYVLAPLELSANQMLCVLGTVGLASVLACAYGFFRVFEKPFMSAPTAAGARIAQAR